MQAKVTAMRQADHGKRTGALVAALVIGTLGANARAADLIPRDEGFMKPPNSVAHRIYSLDGKSDFGFAASISIKNRLTEHYGALLSYDKQFNEYLALDVLVGGGYGSLTSLAERVRETLTSPPKNAPGDLADAGSLLATGQLGVRLTPFYGKLSLAAELPVHFNLYFNLGVGGAFVRYDRVLTCAKNRTGGKCPGEAYLSETKPTLGLNVGGGMRFFLTPAWSIRLEMRAIAFPDQWNQNVNLQSPLLGPGTPATDPGWSWVPLFTVGAGFLL